MRTLALALVISACPLVLSAQQPGANPAPAPGNVQSVKPLFRATLPGGTYQVAVASIVSVSSHEYLVDGVARVTEVNIDTVGSVLARFYYLEPVQQSAPGGIGAATVDKAQQLLREAAARTGEDVWQKVIKHYPTTTHSRTVEYRVASRDDLDKIFKAAEEAFRLQRQKSVRVE